MKRYELVMKDGGIRLSVDGRAALDIPINFQDKNSTRKKVINHSISCKLNENQIERIKKELDTIL